MTRFPTENRNVVDRPDLPEYELNAACPVTGEVTGLDNHHIFRRSAGYHSWWVELWDGTVVGNRVNLSSRAHYRITTNKARISYEDGLFYWIENEEKTLLKWQPPKLTGEEADIVSGGDWVSEGHEKTEQPVLELAPREGEECLLCRRRVPHKKKETSPKTKVYSTRVPVDDVETFREILNAAADHAGMKARPYHEYNTILTGLALVLQSPPEHLPGG